MNLSGLHTLVFASITSFNIAEMLPKEFTTTTHWSEEELRELQASSLAGNSTCSMNHKKVFTRRKLKAMERQYNALVADLTTVHPNLIDTKKFTFHEYKWALSGTCSKFCAN